MMNKQDMIDRLESLVSTVRSVAVGNDPTRIVEYQLVEQYARAFLADPTSQVPLAVSSWSTVSGMNDIDAANSIVQAADNYVNLVMLIRNIRLSARYAIEAAESDAEAEIIFDNAIDTLKAIQLQVV